MPLNGKRAALLALLALFLIGPKVQAQDAAAPKPFVQPEFVEADCPMWFAQSRYVQVDCGYVSVLEDRSRPEGTVIKLAVARLRGSVPSPNPDPVIYLAGGPGGSATESIERFIDDGRVIWEERDLILFDQRGIGHSEPRLECAEYRRHRAEARTLDLDPDEELQQDVDALLACKRRLSEQGIRLSTYTPVSTAADVVDLAAAMGYRTFNLYGSSYGTTLALIVMRDFPGSVRSAILDGVLPLQVNHTETEYDRAASALDAFFRHCEADSRCAERYSEIEQDFWTVVEHYRNIQPPRDSMTVIYARTTTRKSTATRGSGL